jgi:hypothetical protein
VIRVDVNTSHCGFKTNPTYFASLDGSDASLGWTIRPTHMIPYMARGHFRFIVLQPKLLPAGVLAAAKKNKWGINWIGATGQNTGMTKKGNTGWNENADGSVHVDVDTSRCNYGLDSNPTYFTSFHSHQHSWQIQGANIVHQPTETGFRIYVFHRDCIQDQCNEKSLSATKAETQSWSISWIGVTSDSDVFLQHRGGNHQQKVLHKITGSTRSIAKWQSIRAPETTGMYVDVDTSKNSYMKTPSYVSAVSITTAKHHLPLSGAGNIFRANKDGFRVYMSEQASYDSSKFLSDARGWKVHYLAFDGK